ncbi:MAG TPA: hypothetical protein VMB74_06525 [Streptosporangiaceae bacterium]|nr:hypothetical protein [Streptosporangiaceae bacterium]
MRNWGPGPLSVALIFLLGIIAVALGGLKVASAVSAQDGHGIAGDFVAQRYGCGRSGCQWTGEFEQDGVTVRSGVEFYGSDPAMTVGSIVPALDTGDPFGVYQPHGSDLWTYGGAVSFLFIGAVCLAVAVMAARRRWWPGPAADMGTQAVGQPESWLGPES